jgi:uncharacterized protein YbaR (Trm112 family)
MPLDPALLEIVRCPKCHGKVSERASGAGSGLACEACKLLYPVVDEIPDFLVEDAVPLE